MTLENLGTTVIYTDRLPLQWETNSGLDETYIARLNWENEEYLRHLLLLDEHFQESGDEDENYPGLARIELKLNLLIDLIGQLLVRQMIFPTQTSLRIAGTGVEWIHQSTNNTLLSMNETGIVKIYLNSNYPRSLQLPCKIVTTTSINEGQRIIGVFENLSEGVRDQLEKWIFRRHRRFIAQERRHIQQE